MFDRWKAARIQLSNAIQTFSDASSALNRRFNRSISAYPDRSNLEAHLAALDAELPSLFADNRRLDEEHARLGATRNASEKIALINKLPVDVLSRIFAIVIGWDYIDCNFGLPGESYRGAMPYAILLSSVCTTWRDIVTNTPSYWSHIDLSVISGQYSMTEYNTLCIQRSKGTPIDLHIQCKRRMEVYEPGGVKQIITPPESLHNRILASLKLILFRQESARTILLAWINYFSRLTSLSIIFYPQGGVLSAPFPEVPDQDLYSKLFRLHTLNLRGLRMDWNRATFLGLINLRLSFMDTNSCPRMDQLRTMLIASPGLRTLQLHYIELKPPELRRYDELPPVHLKDLTLLCFENIAFSQVVHLLRIIIPGKGYLCFNIKPRPAEVNYVPPVLRLVSRKFNVRTMSLHMRQSNLSGTLEQLGHTLATFKHLRTLNLSFVPLCSAKVIDIICARPESTPSGPSPHHLNLRQLRLHQCCLTAHGLRRIVSSHLISWLRMDQCHIHEEAPENHANSTFVPFRSNIPDDLRVWLGNKVSELYIDHKFKTVGGWGYSIVATDKDLPWWLSSFEA